MDWSYDGKMTGVERRYLAKLEPFGQGNYRGVRRSERKTAVLVYQDRHSQDIRTCR